MSITYTYTIASVDETARCMEIIYESAGHQTMRVGARLPFEGEALESVVQSYAPLGLWEAMAAAVVAPQVGVTGTITPVSQNPITPAPVDTPVDQLHEV